MISPPLCFFVVMCLCLCCVVFLNLFCLVWLFRCAALFCFVLCIECFFACFLLCVLRVCLCLNVVFWETKKGGKSYTGAFPGGPGMSWVSDTCRACPLACEMYFSVGCRSQNPSRIEVMCSQSG